MTKAEQPTITQSVEVTQADIDAVKRFHAESARWMLNAIKNGDPIGEDRDLNHPIYQAFARHRTTSLAAQDVADAVDEAETSLLVWTDAAWNGQIAGDARDFCRAQYGRFKQLRETLGLPEYKRPEFQEGELGIVQASLAAQDGLVEALERCAQIVEQWNHRQNEKVDDIKYIVRNALSAIKGDKS